MQKYSVNQFLVSNILSWVQSGEIAIPEIQRPFVWDTTDVRDLIDSLYKGYPIGYLIAWKNPDVRLKDGTVASGKKVIIDGQQRITALRAAILGELIIDKKYTQKRIVIAFNPIEEKFETLTPAIQKNTSWIPDISEVLKREGGLFDSAREFASKNPGVDERLLEKNVDKLLQVKNRQIGFIDLEPDLDIETVTQIFTRINSKGIPLSQSDFAMSKIASYDSNDEFGINLRKCIDYFCHLAKAPHFYKFISENDVEFAKTKYLPLIEWMKGESTDLYDPDYSDVLRVSFTKQFERGRMSDLVNLLSGRNFEERIYEVEIMDKSFRDLADGVLDFVNESNFKRFLMIITSAGFISKRLITSQNTLNFAYILYLKLRDQKVAGDQIEKFVRKWFVMSVLTGRYSSSPESTFDTDIRAIADKGVEKALNEIEESQMGEAFWENGVSQSLERANINNPTFYVFIASQVKAGIRAFLSTDITVANLITHRGDIHHLFPREYLKPTHPDMGQYNQLANYAFTQTEINIKIGKRSPKEYMQLILKQCETKKPIYGGITSLAELRQNLAEHAIPDSIFELDYKDYENFLIERRKLMARAIRGYYYSLGSETKEDNKDIEKLLKKGETDTVEFKPSFKALNDPNKPERVMEFEIAKSIAAFMNAEGGNLIIGVSDKGLPLGLDDDYKLVKGNSRDGFLIAFDDFIQKYFGKEYSQTVSPEIVNLEGKDVCVVTIYKSGTPVFVENEGKEVFFVRASASTRNLTPSETLTYVKSHWG